MNSNFIQFNVLRTAKWLCVPLAALFISACGDDPKPIVPLKTAEDVKAQPKKPRKTPARPRNRGSAPMSESSYEVAMATSPTPVPMPTQSPALTPEPTKTPEPYHDPLILKAVDMPDHDNGAPDNEGGWLLWANGKIQQDMVKLEFTANKLVLDMKGMPALGIWPEVDLNMYNRTTKENFFPFNRDYVTTSSYHEYRVNLTPPLPPGDYLVTFRYYNNATPDDSKEDRNVFMRRIELSQ